MYAEKTTRSFIGGDETIIRVLEDADDQVLASFVVNQGGELEPLSPRNPSQKLIREARKAL